MKNRIYPLLVVLGSLLLLGALVATIEHSRINTNVSPLVKEVTVDNFADEVINSQTPVFVEFYAQGCKPCDQETAIINQLADEYKGKVKFVRIDAEKQGDISQALGIQAVPTHLLLKPAQKVGVGAQGLMNEADLRKLIEEGLAKQPAPDKAAPSNESQSRSQSNPMGNTTGMPTLSGQFARPLR